MRLFHNWYLLQSQWSCIWLILNTPLAQTFCCHLSWNVFGYVEQRLHEHRIIIHFGIRETLPHHHAISIFKHFQFHSIAKFVWSRIISHFDTNHSTWIKWKTNISNKMRWKIEKWWPFRRHNVKIQPNALFHVRILNLLLLLMTYKSF